MVKEVKKLKKIRDDSGVFLLTPDDAAGLEDEEVRDFRNDELLMSITPEDIMIKKALLAKRNRQQKKQKQVT